MRKPVLFEMVYIRDSLNLSGTSRSEMEQGMTARLDALGSDGPEAALWHAAPGDSPLALFEPESEEVGKEPDDGAALRMDAIPSRAPSVPFATPSVNDGKPRTAGVVNRIKRVLRILDIARDLEKTVDNRLASGHQLLNRVEEQIGELEQRTTSAATELKHVTDVGARFELEVIQLQNQLRPLSEAALGEVKQLRTAADETTMRLGAVRQETERYQREEAHRASAVLAGLETRMAEIGRTHRALDVAERHVEQLEQRAAAAADEVRHATRAKDELQREIAKCQQQIERLTTAAQGEAEKLNGLRRHSEYHGADRAWSPSAHDLLNKLRFWRRGPNTSRGFSPARLILGGAAFALSAAIVLLVSAAWRNSPVENQRPEKPLPAVVLASRALTPAPALAVAPPMPLTADISHDRPEATRPARAVEAVPVPLVVVAKTPVATRGVPTAAIREQSVRKGAKTPQFVGTLLIESDPAGAAVFVNQESVGDTPVLLKDLRAGSYVVRLEHEGYQRWSSAATVSAVRQERVKAKLERERSR